MAVRLLFGLAALAALVQACTQVPRIPGVTPYRMEIQQGNYVSQDVVAQLKPGMTKEEVRFLLGTPLVRDLFHPDRWDYVFWRETADGRREQRNLVLHFADGQLARLEGDVVRKALN